MNKLDRIGTKEDLLEHIGNKQGRDRWFYGSRLNLLTAEVNKFVDELVAEGKIYEHPASGGCYLTRKDETSTGPAPMTGVTITKSGHVETAETKLVKAETVKAKPVKEETPTRSGILQQPEIDTTQTKHAQDTQRVLYYLQNRPGKEASSLASFYGRKVSEFSQVFRLLIGSKTIVRVNGKMFIRGTEPDATTVILSGKNRYNMRRRVLAVLGRHDSPLTQEEIGEQMAEAGDILSPQNLKQLIDALVELGSVIRIGQAQFGLTGAKVSPPVKEKAPAAEPQPVQVSQPEEAPQPVEVPTSLEEIQIKSVPNPMWIHTLELLGKAHEGLVQHICFEIIEHLKRPK